MRPSLRTASWLVLCGLLAATLPAAAQPTWPERPIRLLVPYGNGGPTDIVARAFAESMSRQLGQPFVVEARPGGGTNIAASLVAKAAPDGYTLLISNIASNVLNRALYRRLDYDPGGFAQAGMMARAPLCLLVPPNSAMRSLADVMARARARPEGLTYASNGMGTPTHLVGEMLRQRTGLNLTHVPYAGSAQSNIDVLAGRVDFSFDSCTQQGADRTLAVTYPERWPSLPHVATLAEQGLAGMDLTTFFGIAAPQGTPDAVLAMLETTIATAAADPAVVARFAPTGFVPFVLTRAEATAFIARETENWTRVIRAAEISLD